jgi:hypothetical protein
VQDFHTVLDRLQGIGIETKEFHIPSSAVKPKVVAIKTLSFDDEKSGSIYSREI